MLKMRISNGRSTVSAVTVSALLRPAKVSQREISFFFFFFFFLQIPHTCLKLNVFSYNIYIANSIWAVTINQYSEKPLSICSEDNYE